MDLDPVPAEFAGTQIGFEHTETHYCRRRLCRAHKTHALTGRAYFNTRAILFELALSGRSHQPSRWTINVSNIVRARTLSRRARVISRTLTTARPRDETWRGNRQRNPSKKDRKHADSRRHHMNSIYWQGKHSAWPQSRSPCSPLWFYWPGSQFRRRHKPTRRSLLRSCGYSQNGPNGQLALGRDGNLYGTINPSL